MSEVVEKAEAARIRDRVKRARRYVNLRKAEELRRAQKIANLLRGELWT